MAYRYGPRATRAMALGVAQITSYGPPFFSMVQQLFFLEWPSRACGRQGLGVWESLAECFGVFNYLPSLQMAPLQKPSLFWLLHFYHFSSRGANYLPFSLMWHAKSSRQYGLSMRKDYDAPSLTHYTMHNSLLSL